MIAGMAKTLPRNADVAEQLELLSDILELEGEAAYRLLAYRRAAALVREQSGLVAELALEGKAKALPGIGKTIEGKIVEIVNEGEIRALTKHKALVPPDVVEFTRLPGLGPKTARKIWQELGVTTLADLKAAAKAERLRVLPGIGAKLEERIVKELSGKRKAPEEVRPLLGVGLPAVQAVVAVLREHPAALEVSDAGSVRRRKETFRDLDIIATASEPAALTDYFTKLHWVEKVAAKGESKATVVSNDGLRFDLRVVPAGLYGNLLQHFTGSKHHNVALREDAVRVGFSVSENGVKDVESGEVFKTGSEEALYEFRGYQHLHSTWSSDGKNSIEEMAAEAKSRGYSYLAITDHSHYLRDGRLEAQDREIEALNETLGRFKLLKGIEVNIRADGSLDVDDETLAGRDWVVASLHTAFDKNPTERVVSAMENPNVDCIGHLTARKINRRGPADIDLSRVFETALATKTFLEINSQPDRLDLRDAHARAAGEAGVLLSISSDAHSTRALAYPELGVGQAGRAWLTKEQVLNTRTWPQIKKLLG